jgi:hypothetical protein
MIRLRRELMDIIIIVRGGKSQSLVERVKKSIFDCIFDLISSV